MTWQTKVAAAIALWAVLCILVAAWARWVERAVAERRRQRQNAVYLAAWLRSSEYLVERWEQVRAQARAGDAGDAR